MIVEDGLDRGDGCREPAGLAAEDRCDRFGGIAAPLGPDADGVPLGVGRVLSEGLAGPFQPSPGSADQAGDHSGGLLPGKAGRLGGDRRLRGDADQGVEELVVAGAGELLQERGASLACLVAQAADELFDAGIVLVGQQVSPCLKTAGEDIGVTRGPGLGAEQAQPAAQFADRLCIQELGERAQVRP